MATLTTNLGLRKPDDNAAGGGDDLVDVTLDIANNMDILDAELGNIDAHASDVHTRLTALESDVAALEIFMARYQRVSKSANQSYTSDTTLNDDTHLTLPVEANKRYKFHMHLQVESPSTADFKWDITGPASFTCRFIWLGSEDTDAVNAIGETGFPRTHSTSGGTGGSADSIDVIGFVRTAGTAGSILLRHAQNTSDAGTTLVQQGSWMTLEDTT